MSSTNLGVLGFLKNRLFLEAILDSQQKGGYYIPHLFCNVTIYENTVSHRSVNENVC